MTNENVNVPSSQPSNDSRANRAIVVGNLLLAWIAAQVAATIWAAVTFEPTRGVNGPGPFGLLVRTAGLWVALGAAAFWLVFRPLGPRPWPSPKVFADRVRFRFRLSDLPVGIASGWLLHEALIALYWCIGKLFHDLKVDGPAREIVEKSTSMPGNVALIALVVVGAPLAEELFYRGAAQNVLQQRFGDVPGLLVTAVFFAAAHIQIVQFPGLFVVGIGLGWIYQRSGRLGTNIVTHGVFNLLTLLSLWGVAIPGL